MNDAVKEEIKVEAVTLKELLEKAEFPLGFDNYQRPYVWTAKKIKQLLDDLVEFTNNQSSKPNYYMGVLLLHKNSEKEYLFVIDGQQRLTSLSVLHHVLTESLPENIKFEYRSPLSAKNIQQAKTIFSAELKLENLRDKIKNIFEQLTFTVVTVNNEDLAFTFFDTQNNRGVPLKATDLLKAFHLRAINSKREEHSEEHKVDDEKLQMLCARRWENLQQHGEKEKQKGSDFAPKLFHEYLWRARNWTGQKNIVRETHDDVLETFQTRSVFTEEVNKLPLYVNVNNCRASALTLQENDQFILHLKPIDLTNSAESLPFSLRQPIHQGVGFFLYAEKYATLIKQTLHDEEPTTELKAFRVFYKDVVKSLSHYLQELYLLAIVMYIDKFSHKQLLEFALWLDYSIGSIRLDKFYIFKQAPLNYLKHNSEQNLLDVIAGAYRADEIIYFLKMDESVRKIYEKGAIDIECGKGVKGEYLQKSLEYYGKKKEDIKQKSTWIVEDFIEGKINVH